MEQVQRSSAANMRKTLQLVNLLTRVGIDFVPIPIVNEKDKEFLVTVMTQRLEQYHKMLDDNANEESTEDSNNLHFRVK